MWWFFSNEIFNIFSILLTFLLKTVVNMLLLLNYYQIQKTKIFYLMHFNNIDTVWTFQYRTIHQRLCSFTHLQSYHFRIYTAWFFADLHVCPYISNGHDGLPEERQCGFKTCINYPSRRSINRYLYCLHVAQPACRGGTEENDTMVAVCQVPCKLFSWRWGKLPKYNNRFTLYQCATIVHSSMSLTIRWLLER